MSALSCGCDPDFRTAAQGVIGWECAAHRGREHTTNTTPIEGIKNSGVFVTSASGMKRDANPDGAIEYSNILHGPMYDRWAQHLTRAKMKYPDAAPGIPNWTLGATQEDLLRFRESAFRHMRKWMRGDQDEDHAAAVFFNLNGYEYVKTRLQEKS